MFTIPCYNVYDNDITNFYKEAAIWIYTAFVRCCAANLFTIFRCGSLIMPAFLVILHGKRRKMLYAENET